MASSLEYGNSKRNLLDSNLGELRLESNERVHRIGAIPSAHPKGFLLKHISHFLSNPDHIVPKRRGLVNEQIPADRGCAVEKVTIVFHQLQKEMGFQSGTTVKYIYN